MGEPAESWRGASAYDRFMGRWSRPLADRFVAWAGIAPGAKAIDVGCGTGALSGALLRAGAAAVVGTDRSADFVAGASAAFAGDPRARFECRDATDLQETTCSFDAALSSLVLNFVDDPPRMVAEMARVTRPGGTVAVCVWDYAGKMEMLRFFWDEAAVVDPDGGLLADEGRRFPVCHPGPLADLLQEAGVDRVRTAPLEIPMPFSSFDDYWVPFTGGGGPAQQYLAGLAPARRDALRGRLRTRLAGGGDGPFTLVGRAWAAAGTAR